MRNSVRPITRPAIPIPTEIPSHTAEILPLQKKLRPLLRRAWPDASEKDISWFTADLAGLWEVSRWHIKLVRKLLKIHPIRDIGKLQDISQELDVNWSNARSHLEIFEGELQDSAQSLLRKSKEKSEASWLASRVHIFKSGALILPQPKHKQRMSGRHRHILLPIHAIRNRR